jgi:hypothetical protein
MQEAVAQPVEWKWGGILWHNEQMMGDSIQDTGPVQAILWKKLEFSPRDVLMMHIGQVAIWAVK